MKPDHEHSHANAHSHAHANAHKNAHAHDTQNMLSWQYAIHNSTLETFINNVGDNDVFVV